MYTIHFSNTYTIFLTGIVSLFAYHFLSEWIDAFCSPVCEASEVFEAVEFLPAPLPVALLAPPTSNSEPEVTEPEISQPEVTEPEVTEPEVTEPEVTEPEVTEPEVTEPEVTLVPKTPTVKELRAIAKAEGIKGASKLSKAKLLELLGDKA